MLKVVELQKGKVEALLENDRKGVRASTGILVWINIFAKVYNLFNSIRKNHIASLVCLLPDWNNRFAIARKNGWKLG